MSESNFLPVKPNINGENAPANRDRNIFANNKDADIQQFINNKKMNALSIDSPKTKEEILVSKKEQQKSSSKSKDSAQSDSPDEPSGDGTKNSSNGFSWVIIGLAIVIIILILIIVYYVINYNNITSTPLIPESVMKPTPVAKQPSVDDMKESNNITYIPDKPVATKNDLTSVLNRLQTIPEVDEQEHIEAESDKNETPAQDANKFDKHTEMCKESLMENIIEEKLEDMSKASYSEYEMDPELIDEFRAQAMDES